MTAGVNVIEHPLLTRVQLVRLNVPVRFEARPTVWVGIIIVGGEVSATVTLHVVASLTLTEVGKHDTSVVVVRRTSVTFVEPALIVWFVSPP